MPKGTKMVDWTNPKNDAKLLNALLKHVDASKYYGPIAKEFGDAVTAVCIATRIAKIKRTVKEGEIADGSTDTTPRKTGRTSAMASQGNAGARAKKGIKTARTTKAETNDDSLADEMMKEQAATSETPNDDADKVISGRVTKPRVSSRKNEKKDYKTMIDPFNSMTDAQDETREVIFRHEKSESEDSNPADPEFDDQKSPFQLRMESWKAYHIKSNKAARKEAAMEKEAAMAKEAAMEMETAMEKEEAAMEEEAI